MGLDVSPLALEVCRARGLAETRLMSVHQVSRSLGTFDPILMMGGGLGLLADREKGKRLLDKLDRITSRRARIIGVTRDPYDTEDPAHLAYHEVNRRRGRMPGQVRLRVRYKHYKSPWFDYLLSSRDELFSMFEGSPWRLHRTIDSVGSPYVAVVEKA